MAARKLGPWDSTSPATDPYIRQFHQARNLMELIDGIAAVKDAADEVTIKLGFTSEHTEGEDKVRKQLEFLLKVQQAASVAGINLDVSLDGSIRIGTQVAQESLRAVLGFGNARQITAPEAYISFKPCLFIDDGEVTDESTAALLADFMQEFRDHTERVRV